MFSRKDSHRCESELCHGQGRGEGIHFYSPPVRTKALVLELLAAVCLVRGGHEIILAAFDNFKEVSVLHSCVCVRVCVWWGRDGSQLGKHPFL